MPLPIHEIRDAIVNRLRDPGTPNLLLKAPTGSGKSTQVPQFILDSGLLADGDDIVVLQPRRIAARMLARRVAQERKVRLGDEVGYQVRFENHTSRSTRIRFVTEGVLLRQLLQNPDLKGTGCVIIDEFHERHLDGDLALAWSRAVQMERRPDLKIIVMSATLAPGPLADFLDPCETLESEGRTFPVDVRYQPPGLLRNREPEPVWDQTVRACETLAQSGEAERGNILVFMPGAYEISKTIAALGASRSLRPWKPVALHGQLSPADQDAAVSPDGPPRIIVATNVAETSLTIEGVRAVVDSGLARVAAYDPRRGINTLTIEKISQASAEQRAGRAGRLGPGIAIRLWTQADQTRRDPQTVPEVHRLELSEALLALKTAATDSRLTIDWFEAPKPAALDRARSLLHSLDALDTDDRITPTGRAMAAFPAHPRLARLLLASADLGCLHEAATCAAIAQGRGILVRQRSSPATRQKTDFWEPGDVTEFQASLRALQHAENMRFDLGACSDYGIHARSAREAAQMRDQLLRLAERSGLHVNTDSADPEHLAKALLAAFSEHLGTETGSGSRVYTLPGGYRGHLEKDAHIKPPPLLIAAEITEIQGKALQVKLGTVTRIEEPWLDEIHPGHLIRGHRAAFDAVQRRVVNYEETRFRDLVLASRERGEPDRAQAAALLATEVAEGRLVLNHWNERVEQWIIRLNRLSEWMPELELPQITPEDRHFLLEQICQGATAYRQIKDRDVFPALHQWLAPGQRELLDLYTPERLPLRNGKSAKITYAPDQPPAISAVLQHLYDMTESPAVAAGRVPLTVHLLSPAQRPIATTGDLARFWKEGYPLVKKDLKGRYPKHEWR